MSNNIFARAQAILATRNAEAQKAQAVKEQNEMLMSAMFEGAPNGAVIGGGMCRLQGDAIFGAPELEILEGGVYACPINPEAQLGSNARLLASRRQKVADLGSQQAQELNVIRKDHKASQEALAEMLELRVFAENTKKFCDKAKAEIAELEASMEVADEVYADQLSALDELLANW